MATVLSPFPQLEEKIVTQSCCLSRALAVSFSLEHEISRDTKINPEVQMAHANRSCT